VHSKYDGSAICGQWRYDIKPSKHVESTHASSLGFSSWSTGSSRGSALWGEVVMKTISHFFKINCTRQICMTPYDDTWSSKNMAIYHLLVLNGIWNIPAIDPGYSRHSHNGLTITYVRSSDCN
jgi:hypothetical protein